jgi:hypothetical protein
VSDGRKDRSDGGKTESSTQKRADRKKTQPTKHTNDATGFRPKDEHEEGNNLTWPGDTPPTTKTPKPQKNDWSSGGGAAQAKLGDYKTKHKKRKTKTTPTHTHTHIMETAAVDALQQSSVL